MFGITSHYVLNRLLPIYTETTQSELIHKKKKSFYWGIGNLFVLTNPTTLNQLFSKDFDNAALYCWTGIIYIIIQQY